ncbi:MAG TPA: AMP-binding protein, partial [Solirubrobacterales bacterium]|nr:AMP-binding protein [Solirubrobacterales bacterium]
GIANGVHAARLMANSLENIDTWFGMIRGGVVEVPINTGNVGMSLQYVIDQSDARALVLDEQYLERFAAIASELPKLEHVIVNRSSSEPLPVDLPARLAVHDLADLYLADEPPAVALDGSSIASILYTSGTTGPSKGVVVEHEFMDTLTRWSTDLMRYTRDDVIFTFFPLFHLMARNCGTCAAIESDAKLIIGDRFSASTFWDTCRDNGITAITYLGDMGVMLANQPRRDDDADNPVTRGFGAGMSLDLWQDFEDRFGLTLTEIYGMTELGGTMQNTATEKRIGSVGKPAPHFEVELRDEDDLPVPLGMPGEIVVRPKRPRSMFREYYKMPEETVRAFRNLWFHTGDRARQDEEGFFYFVDRTKDMIRRRGENISSFEVERVISAHEAVAEAAAYGVIANELEEVMVSVVPVDAADPPDPEELVEFASANLPKFALPRFIRFVELLPRNASQRLIKFELRETGVTEDTWDRERATAARR